MLDEGDHPIGHEPARADRGAAAGDLGDLDHAAGRGDLDTPARLGGLDLVLQDAARARVHDDLHPIAPHNASLARPPTRASLRPGSAYPRRVNTLRPGDEAPAFALLDQHGERVRLQGVREGRTTIGLIRSAFLVDEAGRIERVWSPVKPEDTVPNALAALAA